MDTSPNSYRKLPGRGVGLAGACFLYAGLDHLLLVSRTGYAETYKRFYYRDIQAIVLSLNRVQLVWSYVWGGLLLACVLGSVLVLTAASSIDRTDVAISLAVTAVVALPLVANLLLGPTCTCCVQTAVQTDKLPSLRRLRKAQRVLQRLKPLIDSAQGALGPQPQPAPAMEVQP
jgi:glucose-6-phosphate-specific signal transduction histidine kinase